MTDLAAPPPEDVASPCVGVCALDAAGRLCLGCGRTLDEIAGWSTADAAHRRAIRAAAAARLVQLPA